MGLRLPYIYVPWSYAIYTIAISQCMQLIAIISSIICNITKSHYPSVMLMATTYTSMASNCTEIIVTTATSVYKYNHSVRSQESNNYHRHY